MENILEDQRRLHEERERLIDVQAKEILRKKQSVKIFNKNYEILFTRLFKLFYFRIVSK